MRVWLWNILNECTTWDVQLFCRDGAHRISAGTFLKGNSQSEHLV